MHPEIEDESAYGFAVTRRELYQFGLANRDGFHRGFGGSGTTWLIIRIDHITCCVYVYVHGDLGIFIKVVGEGRGAADPSSIEAPGYKYA